MLGTPVGSSVEEDCMHVAKERDAAATESLARAAELVLREAWIRCYVVAVGVQRTRTVE